MENNGDLRHLTSEQMQAFLDCGLPPLEESGVREHLALCPRCRGEVEAWSALFSQLGALPSLEPSPGFSREVLGRLPVQLPLTNRAWGWMTGKGVAGHGPSAHYPSDRIQDHLDGLLPARQGKRLLAHLSACQPCAEELRGWDHLFGSLGTLGRHAPTPDFGERVMARVRLPVPAPLPWSRAFPGRALAWARTLLPGTRRGWAVAGGIATAPTITVVALLYELFSRPLLSLGSLSTYAYWKGSAVLGALLRAVADRLVESVAMFRAYTLVETLAASPVLVGLGGLAFSLLSAGALWVLYRNLVTAPQGEGHHAHARV